MEQKDGRVRASVWRSIQWKYVFTYVVVIAAVLMLLNTYPVRASQNLVMQQSKKAALQSQTAVMASALMELESLSTDQVSRVLTVLGDMGLDRILVTDSAGVVLYDSTLPEGAEETVRYALFQEITAALQGKDVFRSIYRDGVISSCAAEPVVYRNVTIGAIYIHETDAAQGALLRSLQATLRTLSLIICLLTILLSLVFSRVLTARLGELLRAIRIVREGEYSHRVELKGKDELAMLASEFNQLTDRLQTTEEVRRRFVSDASHELKTPLASIRLLSDSILQSKNMDQETLHEFVGDIGSEADRLARITEDLLTLTRIDSAPPERHGPVPVAKVAERVAKMLRPLARAVRVELTVDCGEYCVVDATEDDLYKIIYNLAENAIKYNLPEGKVGVTAFTADREGRPCTGDRAEFVALQVCDTGVGIPEEDLDKIFNRFYRVDKARSRMAGGTGLGLAIVRDTAEQYGGRVSVRRREGVDGSEFTVLFPRCRERGGQA